MTQDDSALREAFEKWWPVHMMMPTAPERFYAQRAFLAGAAHAREEAEKEIAGMADDYQREAGRCAAAEDALPEGYSVDAEHTLADRVRELAAAERYSRLRVAIATAPINSETVARIEDERDSARAECELLRMDVLNLKQAGANLTAAECAVVDAALPWWRDMHKSGWVPTPHTAPRLNALYRACAALADAQKPRDPVREAAERVRARLDAHSFGNLAMFAHDDPDMRAILDAALSDREDKP